MRVMLASRSVLVLILPLTLAAAAVGCAAAAPAGLPGSPAYASPGAGAPMTVSAQRGATEEMSAPPPPVPGIAGGDRAPSPMTMETSAPTERPMATVATPPQQSTIRAGEWDDNANYREFQSWLASESSLKFHRVDIRDRRFLVVRDAQGKAVPRCRVVVRDEAQHETTLTTVASGRAILFPRAEGLQGSTLSATASCAGTTASASFSLVDPDGVVDLKLPASRQLAATPTVDIGFILDTTGSMSEEITAVKATLQRVASSLGGQNVHVRVGMVAFKDRGDEYVTRVFPMTTDLDSFQREVASVSASGGGDTPESVNEGLHAAMTRLAWGQDSIAQFAFLVGDAPPHLDYAQDFDYAAEMKDAAHRGIQIFTVAASGMDEQGQAVWRQLAAYTDATNLFVLRGGAGPQSTGAGDPLSSCGGTQQSYSSGNLDGLILAKIRHELHGVDRDPLKIPGAFRDENAKPCNERFLATD